MKTILASSLLLGSLVSVGRADTVVVAAGDDGGGRTGLVLGATIDGGNIGCQTKNGDDCGDSGAKAAGGFSVHVGGMVTPQLAILAEAWGMAHTEDNITASQGLLTANLRAWIVPRFWVQAGVGVARSKISYDGGFFMSESESDTVPAGVLAVGLEVLHSREFALDVELRGGSGFYQGDARVWNTALGVGISWF